MFLYFSDRTKHFGAPMPSSKPAKLRILVRVLMITVSSTECHTKSRGLLRELHLGCST